MTRVGVGIVGCGAISGLYARNLARFAGLALVACADVDIERARRLGLQFSVKPMRVDELLRRDDVAVVVNLTPPLAHTEVSEAIIRAGKSLYSEKPFAFSSADAAALLTLAAENGVPVGCSPDTALGAGLQACRGVLDGGEIGEPIAASTFVVSSRPDRWAMDASIDDGADALHDVGPYHVTALAALLGPVVAVQSMGADRVSRPPSRQRHVTASLRFASGVVGSLIASFDVVASDLPRLEIYGTAGVLSGPDPNSFGGPVRVRSVNQNDWRGLTVGGPYAIESRGLGVADLVGALREGRAPRASGELAAHVVEVTEAILTAQASGCEVAVASRISRPAPMPLGGADPSMGR